MAEAESPTRGSSGDRKENPLSSKNFPPLAFVNRDRVALRLLRTLICNASIARAVQDGEDVDTLQYKLCVTAQPSGTGKTCFARRVLPRAKRPRLRQVLERDFSDTRPLELDLLLSAVYVPVDLSDLYTSFSSFETAFVFLLTTSIVAALETGGQVVEEASLLDVDRAGAAWAEQKLGANFGIFDVRSAVCHFRDKYCIKSFFFHFDRIDVLVDRLSSFCLCLYDLAKVDVPDWKLLRILRFWNLLSGLVCCPFCFLYCTLHSFGFLQIRMIHSDALTAPTGVEWLPLRLLRQSDIAWMLRATKGLSFMAGFEELDAGPRAAHSESTASGSGSSGGGSHRSATEDEALSGVPRAHELRPYCLGFFCRMLVFCTGGIPRLVEYALRLLHFHRYALYRPREIERTLCERLFSDLEHVDEIYLPSILRRWDEYDSSLILNFSIGLSALRQIVRFDEFVDDVVGKVGPSVGLSDSGASAGVRGEGGGASPNNGAGAEADTEGGSGLVRLQHAQCSREMIGLYENRRRTVLDVIDSWNYYFDCADVQADVADIDMSQDECEGWSLWCENFDRKRKLSGGRPDDSAHSESADEVDEDLGVEAASVIPALKDHYLSLTEPAYSLSAFQYYFLRSRWYEWKKARAALKTGQKDAAIDTRSDRGTCCGSGCHASDLCGRCSVVLCFPLYILKKLVCARAERLRLFWPLLRFPLLQSDMPLRYLFRVVYAARAFSQLEVSRKPVSALARLDEDSAFRFLRTSKYLAESRDTEGGAIRRCPHLDFLRISTFSCRMLQCSLSSSVSESSDFVGDLLDTSMTGGNWGMSSLVRGARDMPSVANSRSPGLPLDIGVLLSPSPGAASVDAGDGKSPALPEFELRLQELSSDIPPLPNSTAAAARRAVPCQLPPPHFGSFSNWLPEWLQLAMRTQSLYVEGCVERRLQSAVGRMHGLPMRPQEPSPPGGGVPEPGWTKTDDLELERCAGLDSLLPAEPRLLEPSVSLRFLFRHHDVFLPPVSFVILPMHQNPCLIINVTPRSLEQFESSQGRGTLLCLFADCCLVPAMPKRTAMHDISRWMHSVDDRRRRPLVASNEEALVDLHGACLEGSAGRAVESALSPLFDAFDELEGVHVAEQARQWRTICVLSAPDLAAKVDGLSSGQSHTRLCALGGLSSGHGGGLCAEKCRSTEVPSAATLCLEGGDYFYDPLQAFLLRMNAGPASSSGLYTHQHSPAHPAHVLVGARRLRLERRQALQAGSAEQQPLVLNVNGEEYVLLLSRARGEQNVPTCSVGGAAGGAVELAATSGDPLLKYMCSRRFVTAGYAAAALGRGGQSNHAAVVLERLLRVPSYAEVYLLCSSEISDSLEEPTLEFLSKLTPSGASASLEGTSAVDVATDYRRWSAVRRSSLIPELLRYVKADHLKGYATPPLHPASAAAAGRAVQELLVQQAALTAAGKINQQVATGVQRAGELRYATAGGESSAANVNTGAKGRERARGRRESKAEMIVDPDRDMPDIVRGTEDRPDVMHPPASLCSPAAMLSHSLRREGGPALIFPRSSAEYGLVRGTGGVLGDGGRAVLRHAHLRLGLAAGGGGGGNDGGVAALPGSVLAPLSGAQSHSAATAAGFGVVGLGASVAAAASAARRMSPVHSGGSLATAQLLGMPDQRTLPAMLQSQTHKEQLLVSAALQKNSSYKRSPPSLQMPAGVSAIDGSRLGERMPAHGVLKSKKPKQLRRRRKDPRAPRPALSAYLLYCQDIREQVKSDFPEATFLEQGKIFGVRWKQLPESERKRYGMLSTMDKERYMMELAAYRQNHPVDVLSMTSQ